MKLTDAPLDLDKTGNRALIPPMLGLRNDGLTHVGVIESVERDGTVVFVHRGGSGVKRARMNLRFPTLRQQGGRVLNDYIRRAEDGERAQLTSELFGGYASASQL